MKQTKLRRRRVIRYAILYFILFVVFLALIVGPAVAGKYVPSSMFDMLKDNSSLSSLLQPTGLDNNDTRGRTPTGTAADNYTGVGTSTRTSATATATSEAERRALFV